MFSPASIALALAALRLVPQVSAHAALWHKSMFGFNVTQQTFSYDNRPVVPLMNMPFSQWWMHGYLDYPPHPEDVFELPAGGVIDTEISCDKGATSNYASSPGGDAGYSPTNENVCPGQPMSEYHTNGPDDLGGCAIAIAYNDVAANVQPEDFVVISVNYTCVWTLHTSFSIPAELPACPNGKCTCIWTWIHTADSGSEQMYQIPFQCSVTGATNTKPLGQPMLPRRCGADPANGRPDATPGNCTVGPKFPYYWYQAEGNNMFEGTYSPPLYTDIYDWVDGAQPNLLIDAYVSSLGPGSGPTGTPVAPPATSPTAPAPPAVTPSSIPASPPNNSPAPPPASTPVPPPVVVSTSVATSHTVSVAAPPPPPVTSIALPPPPVVTSSSEIVISTSKASPVTTSLRTTASPSFVTSILPSSTRRCKPRPSASASAAANAKRDALNQHRRHARDHTLH